MSGESAEGPSETRAESSPSVGVESSRTGSVDPFSIFETDSFDAFSSSLSKKKPTGGILEQIAQIDANDTSVFQRPPPSSSTQTPNEISAKDGDNDHFVKKEDQSSFNIEDMKRIIPFGDNSSTSLADPPAASPPLSVRVSASFFIKAI